MSTISVKSGRKYFTPQQKVNMVLESFRPDMTMTVVCENYGVHLTQLNRWRKQFKEEAASIFADKRKMESKRKKSCNPGESPDELKRIIGELVVQNEILKKVPGLLS